MQRRLPIYKTYAQKLLASGRAYYCFCGKEDKPALEASNERVEGYRDPCRDLSSKEVEARFAEGLVPVVRQRIPLEGVSSFDDHVYGHISIENKQLDDQVLLKSDGFPTYNFANVVDDHLMEVSHVIRGQEYLSSTPKYNLLYEAFGWEHPEYIHLPHIIREDGAKMSKRKGDPSFEDLVRMGFLPQAIVNYVALLGWNPGDEREFFLMEDLIDAFDMDRINKANAAFSIDKLRWLNGEHIRSQPEAFHRIALHFYPKGLRALTWLRSASCKVRTNTDRYSTIGWIPAALPEYSEVFGNQKSKSTLRAPAWFWRLFARCWKHWKPGAMKGCLRSESLRQERGFKVGTVMANPQPSPVETSPAARPSWQRCSERNLARIKLGLSKLG